MSETGDFRCTIEVNPLPTVDSNSHILSSQVHPTTFIIITVMLLIDCLIYLFIQQILIELRYSILGPQIRK